MTDAELDNLLLRDLCAHADKALGNGLVTFDMQLCRWAAHRIEALLAENADLKTDNGRLEQLQRANEGRIKEIVSDELLRRAESAESVVADLKHDIERHIQIAADLATECEERYRAGIERAAKIAGSYGPKVPVPGTEIAAAIRALLNETAGESPARPQP